nr:alkyl sulfatase C-terminal domain-containing protein [Bradyrhizobium glycinis]
MLRNRVLNHFNRLSASPDMTIKGTSSEIVASLMGGKPGETVGLSVDGSRTALAELLSLTAAPPFWFPIVTRPAWKW